MTHLDYLSLLFCTSVCSLPAVSPGSHLPKTLMQFSCSEHPSWLPAARKTEPTVWTRSTSPSSSHSQALSLSTEPLACLPHAVLLCPWASTCFISSPRSTSSVLQVRLQGSIDVLLLKRHGPVMLGSSGPSPPSPLPSSDHIFILSFNDCLTL